MKHVFFLLAVLITLHVSAQRVTIDNVPENIAAAFKAKFSIAEKVSWAVDDDNYKADFKISKVDFTATFDRAGKWLMTEKFIKPSELPKVVRDSVTKEFGQLSGYTYEDVERVETEKGITYEMNIKKGELAYELVISEKGDISKLEQLPEKKDDED